jgi:hypothetical protein
MFVSTGCYDIGEQAKRVLRCVVSSHCLSMTSEQTEDFMCAVAVVIYSMCKLVTVCYKHLQLPVVRVLQMQ